ncbi:MAG: SURF1 family protein [Alphaproteobacteria bacterium]|nr:SURF1 family protein [Alphaproteobacteria bacterium]
MAFRPTFWASVVAVPVLVILLGLGTWQVQRLTWKNNLIETRTERIADTPLGLAEAVAAMPAAIEYRPITLAGTLHADHAFRLLNRLRDGRQGFHLVSPMVLDGGQGAVLVDRGWMPRDALGNIPVAPPRRVVLEGYVRAFTAPGAFLPDNEPGNNNWFHMNEAEMLAAAGLSDGLGFYVEAGPDANPPGVYPAGAVPEVNLRNSHLEYAVTWYGLAAVLVVIFVVFHWRRGD